MKKITIAAILLALLCCFVTAGAQEEDFAAANESRQILESVGARIPEKDLGENLTRIEFIKLICGLLDAPELPENSCPYTDIAAADGAGAVAYAYSAGYIAKDTLFRPSEAIKLSDAYAIAVRVIGREAATKQSGGYPSGYSLTANRYGLCDNIRNPEDGLLTLANALVLMENIGRCDAVVISSIDGKNVEYKYEKSFFEVNYDMYEITGVVTANEDSALYSGANETAAGKVMIDETEYHGGENLKLGERVKGWVREVDDEWYIINVKPHKNASIEIALEDFKGYENAQIKYDKNSSVKTARIDKDDYAVIYNGKASGDTVLNSAIGKKSGKIELVDNDGDGKYEVINVREYQVVFVSTASGRDKIITDKNADAVVNLSSSDKKYRIYENGKLSTFDTITDGKLLLVYMSEDKLLYEIDVYSDTVEAEIVSKDKAEGKITIGETEYDVSEYFEKYYLDKLVLGQKLEFYVADDVIMACTLDQSSNMMFGYIVRVRKFDGDNGEVVRFKIFNEKGSLENYDLAEKVKVDDEMVRDNDVVMGMFVSGEVINRQLIRFKTNSKGELSVIDTCNKSGRLDPSAKATDNLTKYEFPKAVATSLWYIESNDSFHPYFRISEQTKIFMVADGDVADDKRCVLKTTEYFKTNRSQKSANLNVYNVSYLGVAGAIVVVDSSAVDPTAAKDASLGIVYSVMQTINDDDVLTYKLSIFENGKFNYYYIAEDAVDRFVKDGERVAEKGDAVRYSLDTDGNINAIVRDYNMKEATLTTPFTDNSTGTHTAKGVVYSGMAYDVSGSDITIVPQGIPGIAYDPADETSRFSMGLASCKIYIVEKNCERIYLGSVNDIMTYRNSGAECDNLLIRVNDGVAQFAIVYK